MDIETRRFRIALTIPFTISVLIVLVFILERGMGMDFSFLGVYPRHVKGLLGIITYPFIHGSWAHCWHNLIPLFLLSTTLFYFYAEIAANVLLYLWVSSGLLLWVIGRESFHIGASGIIYGLAAFLFVSGIIRRHIPLVSISLIVVFMYGGMVWDIFPWRTDVDISWEGHLSGGVCGLILAIIFRHQGPQKPIKEWSEEPDDAYPYWTELDEIDETKLPKEEADKNKVTYNYLD